MPDWTDPTTFAQVWANAVTARSDETFLVFEAPDGSISGWTYREFDAVVERVAASLVAAAVGAGEAVHIALTNCPTFVAVWIAAIRLGAWIVPGDPMGKEQQFADQIQRTQAKVGFYALTRAGEYLPSVPPSMTAVAVDETDASFDSFPDVSIHHWPTPALMDRAAVMFTSGTTGRPKGVEITQANYAFAGKTMAEACRLQASDRYLVVLPLFHANAQYYSFAAAIWVGASVALMATFSARGFLPQAARHGATCASLFAAPLRMILARGGPVEGLRLRHCWFAQNIGDEQYATIVEWFGCEPRQLYGMTETIPAVLTDEADQPRPDVMGYVTRGCEVDIHDEDGRALFDGEVGEVVVRGQRGITLFEGYLDEPITTAANFRQGWFLTGDRASRNSGRFSFEGRRFDILKVAGENVSTVEVEAVLICHPKVLEASVVGAPDSIRDEVPIAYLVAVDADDPPSIEDLAKWCRARLAPAKQPRDFSLLDELPRTSVGKIRKFVLKESAASP